MGDIDPSCGNLVSVSNAPANDSPALPTTSVPTIVHTGVAGADWSWGAFAWPSNVTVLCGSGPTITSIRCKTCKPGSAATIYGTGFSTDKKKDVVYFGKKKVKSIARAKPTSLRLTIPKVKGTVDVYVLVNGEESNHVSFTVK
ncbi:MAG: IPT/TIG domain-containing protein [Acidobacteria bacterium]|nr:IPT/TIG domain-containing protein [Acidobacteriota bacterium]